MKTYLNFGGFYYSDHGSAVEMWVTGPYDCECDDEYDWRQAYDLYANFYVEWFNTLFDTDLVFLRVWSPREYNFQTDSIEVEVNDEDAAKLKRVAHEEFGSELTEMIRRVTTSRSGYIPFYTPETLEDEDDRYMECILDTVLEALGDDWWDYYQRLDIDEDFRRVSHV